MLKEGKVQQLLQIFRHELLAHIGTKGTSSSLHSNTVAYTVQINLLFVSSSGDTPQPWGTNLVAAAKPLLTAAHGTSSQLQQWAKLS